MKLGIDTVRTTFFDALRAHGMSEEQAESSAGVFLDAELAGKPSHGAFHLLTYLSALDNRSINGQANPTATARGSVLAIDADDGLAQFALEKHRDQLLDIARTNGVAVAAGRPTDDASVAVDEGALLPNGGHRGGNLALVFEMLAMLAGGESSKSAANRGDEPPRVGLFALVIDPDFFGAGTLGRLQAHLATLADEHEVYIPGRTRPAPAELDIDDATWEKLA
ncbi:Ldh family oxidoreductase [Corynebacterium sanguinis]|uniref:Ldh family oxidoreductase n=1 Tax=Corynebacterium sanguinis TaxID=2594913 RepID=UPI0021AEED1D|nr:Ldh family oxidoreductase [Corynebacterium sanguinis]MCT2288425.1 Ldh family oxidoreductase [Corynebacterium sanguinis]MDN8622951.1 Ldh family oxidoreductase [Corynebacterium sanguinis]